METGSDNGNDWRPELAAVSGAMPYEPGQPRFDVSAHLSVRLPFPMVAARGPSFCNGVKRRRRPKRYETMREPMERRQGGGNDRRPELATVSGAMPYAPRLRRRALGGVAPAPTLAPAPAPASQSGSLFPWWQQSAPASTPGAPATPRAGEYTTELAARARCPSDTIVWANTPTRIYHYSGTRYYGQTRRGAYMCEADARAAGYRATRSRQRDAQNPSG
jgi:hypothetical protein